MAPSYLKELLTKYEPTRSLRSSQQNLLQCPVFSTRNYGERSFVFAAPSMWNTLPSNLKEATTISQFKTLLKTHLFKQYYSM